MKHLYKEQRYPCPDCKAVCYQHATIHDMVNKYFAYMIIQWYEGDAKQIQLSCWHRQPFETEDLKIWDISLPESDSDQLLTIIIIMHAFGVIFGIIGINKIMYKMKIGKEFEVSILCTWHMVLTLSMIVEAQSLVM